MKAHVVDLGSPMSMEDIFGGSRMRRSTLDDILSGCARGGGFEDFIKTLEEGMAQVRKPRAHPYDAVMKGLKAVEDVKIGIDQEGNVTVEGDDEEIVAALKEIIERRVVAHKESIAKG